MARVILLNREAWGRDANLDGTGREMIGMAYIPYGRQTIEEDDIQAVVDTLRSDYLTTGPKVEEFERAVCEYTGARHAVAVSNGTAALHAACHAAGIGPGDEVITTPLTFAASANCVLYCGGTPVFADIDPRTYNIDPAEVERHITGRTRAVIPVHLAGQPCDMDEIREVARRHHLVVIEDGAHALGATYHGRPIGTGSEMVAFSFHPVKPVTTGEGGMVVTDSEELCQGLRLFRSHCITRDRDQMTECDGPWFYQQMDLGYNYRITDIQCALGVSQMGKLGRFLARRRFLASRYDAAFAGNANVVTPFQASDRESGWHLYMIQVPHSDRREVFDRLREAGIGVNVHYVPVYRHPYYRSHGYADVCCPNAEEVYSHLISLPLYPGLTEAEQDYVIEKVQETIDAVGMEYCG